MMFASKEILTAAQYEKWYDSIENW
jgi:hypothetical protein